MRNTIAEYCEIQGYLCIVKDCTHFMKNSPSQSENHNFFVDRSSISYIQMLRTCFIRV